MEADVQVQELLDTLADLREKANVNACFGEPVTVEGRTIIPVARIGYGFAIGLEQGPTVEEENAEEQTGTGSGGGGMAASPLGVIEITSQGARVEPVIDKGMVAIASILVAAWSAFWVAHALSAIFGRGE